MKKILSLLLVSMITFSLIACSSNPTSQESDEIDKKNSEVIVFSDEVLEGLIRAAMNKSNGDITIAEASEVKQLDLHMEGGASIARVESISDLVYFPNLEFLDLRWCFGSHPDLSVLTSMTKLNNLLLGCTNLINDDLQYINQISSLIDLDIFGNDINDISLLAPLTDLVSLNLQSLNITDISVLKNMTKLENVDISNTQVIDLTPLSNLVNLKKLILSNIPTTDYSSLAEIYPNLEERDFELN